MNNNLDEEKMQKWIENYQKENPEVFVSMQKVANEIEFGLKHPILRRIRYWWRQLKNQFTGIFCIHEWDDGSNLPGCQTFICEKCGKEKYFYPVKKK